MPVDEGSQLSNGRFAILQRRSRILEYRKELRASLEFQERRADGTQGGLDDFKMIRYVFYGRWSIFRVREKAAEVITSLQDLAREANEANKCSSHVEWHFRYSSPISCSEKLRPRTRLERHPWWAKYFALYKLFINFQV